MSTPLDPTPSFGDAPQPASGADGGAPTSEPPVSPSTPSGDSAPIYAPYPTTPQYPYPYPTPPHPGAPPTYTPAPGYSAPPPGAPYAVYYVPATGVPTGATPGMRRRPGYLVAAIGAAAVLLAYFSFPFYIVSIKFTGDDSLGLNFASSTSVTASQVAGTPIASGFSFSSLFALIPVLGIAALLAAIAVPFTTMTASRGMHILSAIVFQVGAVVAAAVLILGSLQFVDQYKDLTNSILGGLSGLDYSFDIGFGLYVLIGGLALVLIGGILVLARGDRAAKVAAPMPVAVTVPPAGG